MEVKPKFLKEICRILSKSRKFPVQEIIVETVILDVKYCFITGRIPALKESFTCRCRKQKYKELCQ